MSIPKQTHTEFKESEMHISNEAYRRYLLDDERSLYDENGEFCQANLAKALMAKLYEEDGGPKTLQKLIEDYEQSC